MENGVTEAWEKHQQAKELAEVTQPLKPLLQAPEPMEVSEGAGGNVSNSERHGCNAMELKVRTARTE